MDDGNHLLSVSLTSDHLSYPHNEKHYELRPNTTICTVSDTLFGPYYRGK